LGSASSKDADIGIPDSRKFDDHFEPPSIEQMHKGSSLVMMQHRIKEVTSQNEFLSDQTRRLNIEVSRLQTILGSNASAKSTSIPDSALPFRESDSLPPWLLSAQHLSPLLVAYDSRIEEMNTMVEKATMELRQMEEAHGEVRRENERLHGEVKQQAQALLEKFEVEGPVNVVGERAAVSVEEWTELTERSELLSSENDVLLEQLKMEQEEREKLVTMLHKYKENEGAMAKSVEDAQRDVQEADQAVDDLLQEKQELEAQLRRLLQEHKNLKSEMSRIQKEGATRRDETTQKTAAVEARESQLQSQLQQWQQEKEEMEKRLKDAMGNVDSLTQKSDNLGRQYATEKALNAKMLKEKESLQSERSQLLSTIADMEKKVAELMRREEDSFANVKESIELLEEARVERDQALFREQRSNREIQRLTERLTQTISSTNERIEKEVESIRESSNQQVAALNATVSKLQEQQILADNQLSKLTRDKTEMESLMRAMRERGGDDDLAAVNRDLTTRVALAEASRDDAIHEADRCRSQNKRSLALWDTEKSALQAKMTEFERKIKRADQEREDLREKNDELQVALNSSKVAGMEREKQALDELAKRNTVWSSEKRSLQQKIEGLEEKLQQVSQGRDMSAEELQILQERQSALTRKWKDEAVKCSNELERISVELGEEIDRLRCSNDDLQANVGALTQKNAELSLQVKDFERANVGLKAMVENTESRNSLMQSRMTSLMDGETVLLDQIRELQKDVDKLELDREGWETQRTELKRRLREAEKAKDTLPLQQISDERQALLAMVEQLKRAKRREHKLKAALQQEKEKDAKREKTSQKVKAQ